MGIGAISLPAGPLGHLFHITLKPANKNYSPIVVSREVPGGFQILGKAVGLTRKI